MISCAKEVFYIVYMKGLPYLLETSPAIFFIIKKFQLVVLTFGRYERNISPKTIYFIERRQEELNLRH